MEITQSTQPHRATVILLHGRDSTATEFAPEFFESQGSDGLSLCQKYPQIRWVFPNAGERESGRFGVQMSQWFDMWSTEEPYARPEIQEPGIEESVGKVLAIIDSEVDLVGAGNVFVGGISQGAVTALTAVLRYRQPLAGYIGLSTWCPKQDWYSSYIRSQSPMFLGHCHDDEVIAVGYGEELCQRLQELDMPVEWHNYKDGGHWINEPAGVDDISNFIDTCLGVKIGIMNTTATTVASSRDV